MTAFFLVGFLAPVRHFPTFLIPYFATTTSNDMFAQELNGECYIERFVKIKPEHYYGVDESGPPMFKGPGQPGFIAYLASTRELVFGNREEIKYRLTKQCPREQCAFFNLEASLFLGDADAVAGNIKVAAQRIATPSSRKSWLNIERAVNKIGERRRKRVHVRRSDQGLSIEALRKLTIDELVNLKEKVDAALSRKVSLLHRSESRSRRRRTARQPLSRGKHREVS
jgi:hypothetical protein